MSVLVKKFVLKHTFGNVSNMEEDDDVYSEEEEHFGVPWRLLTIRFNDHLSLCLSCQKSLDVGKWSVHTNFEIKMTSNNGKGFSRSMPTIYGNEEGFNSMAAGWLEFIEWEEIKRDYLIDDKLTVEAHVTIKAMTGCERTKLRNFDENKLTDIALIVGEQKFHVVKNYLASQSTYFESLLFGNFDESNKSEVILKEIDPEDFQSFLELLYGESAIDDYTIDGIIHLADMYDSPVAIRRCEEFLMKESKMAIERKLNTATKYKLENLKNKCFSEINTVADIRLVADIDEMDFSTCKALFQKCLSLC